MLFFFEINYHCVIAIDVFELGQYLNFKYRLLGSFSKDKSNVNSNVTSK